MVYQEIATATNLPAFASTINGQFEAVRSMERGTTTPGVPVTGGLWEKTDYAWSGGADSAVMRYNGSTFVLLYDPRHPQINAGGTVPMAANLAMGGNKITGLAAATSNGDAVRYEQVATLAGGTWNGDRDAGGYLLANLGSPFSQTSDAVAARYDDTWQTSHGLVRHLETVTPNTGGTDELNQVAGGKRTNPSAATTFCPRLIVLTLAGTVTKLSDSSTLGTLSRQQIICQRLSGDSGYVAFGSTSSYGSGQTLAVEIEFVTSEPRGFRLRLKRSGDNALCGVATCAALCVSGVGMA